MNPNSETGELPPLIPSQRSRQTLFDPGRIVSTPGALDAVSAIEMAQALARHLSGDWGELDHEDILANNHALVHGGRLFSAYTTADKTRFWIITEADRSITTVLRPAEY